MPLVNKMTQIIQFKMFGDALHTSVFIMPTNVSFADFLGIEAMRNASNRTLNAKQYMVPGLYL